MGFIEVDMKKFQPLNILQNKFNSMGIIRSTCNIPTKTGYIEEGTYISNVEVVSYYEDGYCVLKLTQFGTNNTAYAQFNNFNFNEYFTVEPELTALDRQLTDKYESVNKKYCTFIIIMFMLIPIVAIASIIIMDPTIGQEDIALYKSLDMTIKIIPLIAIIFATIGLGRIIFQSIYRQSIKPIKNKLNTDYSLELNKNWMYKPVKYINNGEVSIC